jgi:hypothetical protein
MYKKLMIGVKYFSSQNKVQTIFHLFYKIKINQIFLFLLSTDHLFAMNKE